MTALGATIPLVQVSVRLCQSAGLCWTLPWGLVSPARPPSKPAGRGFGESPHEEERAELRLHSSLESSKAKGRALVFCFPFSIQGVGWVGGREKRGSATALGPIPGVPATSQGMTNGGRGLFLLDSTPSTQCLMSPHKAGPLVPTPAPKRGESLGGSPQEGGPRVL